MGINFGLLGLGPIDRSLTPKGAPGPQAFDALFKGQVFQEQKRANRAQESIQTGQLQETKRSNLAGESLDLDKFILLEDKEETRKEESDRDFDESSRRFNIIDDREERQLGLNIRKQDFVEETSARDFSERVRQFDLGHELDENGFKLRERAHALTEKQFQINLQDREQAQQYKQGLSQAFSEGGLNAAIEYKAAHGDITGALQDHLTRSQIASAFHESGLEDRKYTGEMRQKQLLAAPEVARNVLAKKGTIKDKAYGRLVFRTAQGINKVMGGGRNFGSLSEMEDYLHNVNLGVEQLLSREIAGVSQGFTPQASTNMLGDVLGGDIKTGSAAISDRLLEESLAGSNEPITAFEETFDSSFSEETSLANSSEGEFIDLGGIESSARAALQTKIIDDTINLRKLKDIERDADTGLLNLTDKGAGWVAKVADKWGIASEAQKERLLRQNSFFPKIERFFAGYVKSISGSAVAEPEFKRLKKAVINGDLSPTEFIGRLNDLVNASEKEIRFAADILKTGRIPIDFLNKDKGTTSSGIQSLSDDDLFKDL